MFLAIAIAVHCNKGEQLRWMRTNEKKQCQFFTRFSKTDVVDNFVGV